MPRLEGLGPGGAVLGSRHAVAGQEKEVVDLVVGGEEPLRLSGRLEALHLAFSSAGRLVRVLRPVVEPLVLAVLDGSMSKRGEVGDGSRCQRWIGCSSSNGLP